MKLFHWFVHEDDPLIDTLIVPPVRKYDGADEALMARTQKRRAEAETIRQRAAALETGAPVAMVLKMAKRG